MAAALSATASLQADPARVTAAYTCWDSLYLYAAFNVQDSSVISVNDTLTSHPQQDDDIEVFLETDGPRKAQTRTRATYEMAVSANNGAYFSVGDGSAVPVPKSVLDYKFAAYVDGPLNKGGSDRGYTIELAIPWVEMGMAGPPDPGTVWGFNVISRDRDSLEHPAHTVYSLSPLVQSGADIQDPAKWTQIQFVRDVTTLHSTADQIICPAVSASMPPVVEGTISAGEYPAASEFSFGVKGFEADAPTPQQEPNVGDAAAPATPPASLPPSPEPIITLPAKPARSSGPSPAAPSPAYNIVLPGGGIVHVDSTPGATPGSTVPMSPSAPAMSPAEPMITLVPPKKHGKGDKRAPANETAENHADDHNPLSPKKNPIFFEPDTSNPAADQTAPGAPPIDTSIRPPLPDEPRISQRVMARYMLDEVPDPPLNSYFDQPQSGLGAWFGDGREQYTANQLRNARLSGIEFLLPVFSGSAADINALRSLVQTLKIMDENGDDYPLLGLDLTGSGEPYETISAFFSNVPPQFRGQVFLPDASGNRRAYVVLAERPVDIDSLRTRFERDFGSRATLAVGRPDGDGALVVRTVCPGGVVGGKLVARNQTQTYEGAWANVMRDKPDWVIVDSWNNYRAGTEVSLSRQYADQYANLTRVYSGTWQGQKPWSAAFLASDAPTQIAQKALYEVHVRVENTGTLSWRKMNGYAVSYRWYSKDGTLIDDSAPHILLQDDVPPGSSYTATVGLTALNGFGSSIDPGEYYLVFDVVQGNRRWFSYVDSLPLKVPVTIYDPGSLPRNQAIVLSTTTPEFVKPGATYSVQVRVRNDGGQTWTAGSSALTYGVQADGGPANDRPPSTGEVKLSEDVTPGAVATVNVPLPIPDTAGPTCAISWKVGEDSYKGGFTERVGVTRADPGLIFGLNDMSRQFKTGQKQSVKLAVKNTSATAWTKGSLKIGYRWFYLDGVAAGAATTSPASLPGSVAPGAEVVVNASVKAPDYPGRYTVEWGAVLPDGSFAVDSQSVTRPKETLPVQVWVTPDHASLAVPVDLQAYFNGRGVAFEGEQVPGFDGAGAAIPGEMLPPDGSSELDGDPLLIGKPGPDLYPSGYYSSETGGGWLSNHRISFLFSSKVEKDVVSASGQTIAVPAGQYTAVHVLAAAAADRTVSAHFRLNGSGAESDAVADIAPWTQAGGQDKSSTVAFAYPYRLINGTPDAEKPCVLVDYALAVDPRTVLKSISLPDDPRIKILAVTLEK